MEGRIPLLSEDETATLRSYFEQELAAIGADNASAATQGDSKTLADGTVVHAARQYSLASAHLKSGLVWDLMRHPKLVALVTDILGPDVVGWGAHLFAKLPHDPMRVSFHQDVSGAAFFLSVMVYCIGNFNAVVVAGSLLAHYTVEGRRSLGGAG